MMFQDEHDSGKYNDRNQHLGTRLVYSLKPGQELRTSEFDSANNISFAPLQSLHADTGCMVGQNDD